MSNVPSYYASDQVDKLYIPNTALAMEEGRRAGWSPASRDRTKIALLIVDAQGDFVWTKGSLSVPGSVGDIDRLIRLIYREGSRITTIVPTIDMHVPFMIFFPTWWTDRNGKQPDPYTVITADDVLQKGVWKAVVDPSWSHSYVAKLAKAGKKQLMIWPYHCITSTPGFCLVPPLSEAISFFAQARHSQPRFVYKGQIPQTEFYSPLRPEVDVPGVPNGTINTPILNVLAEHDQIWVTGEAKSHCVLEAMATLTDYFGANQPEVLRRIFFLMDCTSSVQHPAVDFEAIAETELKRMSKDFGVNLVKSTDLYR